VKLPSNASKEWSGTRGASSLAWLGQLTTEEIAEVDAALVAVTDLIKTRRTKFLSKRNYARVAGSKSSARYHLAANRSFEFRFEVGT
jgi:hypothetical protein